MPQAHIHVSNQSEALADELAEAVAAERAGLTPVEAAFRAASIVAPGRAVEDFLRRHLAVRLGAAANLEITSFTGFLGRIATASAPDVRILDRRALQGLLLERLHDEGALAQPELEPLRRYLHAAGASHEAVDRRRLQLSQRLALVFGEYGLGPGGLGPQAPGDGWQRALWDAIFGPEGLASRPADEAGRRWRTLPAVFAELAEVAADPSALRLPPVIHVFAPPPGQRLLPRVLPTLAAAAEVHVYHLQPCREHEEDFDAAVRRRLPRGRFPARAAAREQLSLVAAHDPRDVVDAHDPAPVRAWASADRELLRQIERVLPAASYHPRFAAPAAASRPGLLAAIQRAVLDRGARATHAANAAAAAAVTAAATSAGAAAAADPSLAVVACSGIRREVESIAAEIWSALRADEADEADAEAPTPEPLPLRFDDIAVIVPPADAETYYTHVAAVFREAGEIPFQILDTRLGRASRLVEAVDLLLALPVGGFTRPELLRLLTHPCVMARFPEARFGDWLAFCDRLGIFHGADRSDHADTYIDGDLFNWDQGIRRLVLGALLANDPESPPFEVSGERYLPAALTEDEIDRATGFALFVRSLITDARAAARARLPLPELVALMRALVTTYLLPTDPADERALGACLHELARIAAMPIAAPVSYRLASDLARRAIATLTGSHASHVTRGVTLTTYLPARGLPFRLVFLAGLGAGRFPATDADDELDVRPRRRAPGDVSEAVQDRGLFLSALCAARERLVLSYVARDGQTGDELEPSSLLRELGDWVGAELVPGRRLLADPLRPPLWRHEDEAACAALASAEGEHRALSSGRSIRRIRARRARALTAAENRAPPHTAPLSGGGQAPALQRLLERKKQTALVPNRKAVGFRSLRSRPTGPPGRRGLWPRSSACRSRPRALLQPRHRRPRGGASASRPCAGSSSVRCRGRPSCGSGFARRTAFRRGSCARTSRSRRSARFASGCSAGRSCARSGAPPMAAVSSQAARSARIGCAPRTRKCSRRCGSRAPCPRACSPPPKRPGSSRRSWRGPRASRSWSPRTPATAARA